MPKAALKIPCRYCKGSGCVDMSKTMVRTLNAVCRNDFLTTSEIRSRARVENEGLTAVNNRLTRLLKAGLIEAKEIGRTKLWRVKSG